MQPPPPLTLSARPTTTTTVKRSAAAASAAEATQARALKSSKSVHNGDKVSDDQLATHKLRQDLIGRIETLYNNRGESRPVALASASLPGPHHHMERLRSPTVPAARQTTAAAAATAARSAQPQAPTPTPTTRRRTQPAPPPAPATICVGGSSCGYGCATPKADKAMHSSTAPRWGPPEVPTIPPARAASGGTADRRALPHTSDGAPTPKESTPTAAMAATTARTRPPAPKRPRLDANGEQRGPPPGPTAVTAVPTQMATWRRRPAVRSYDSQRSQLPQPCSPAGHPAPRRARGGTGDPRSGRHDSMTVRRHAIPQRRNHRCGAGDPQMKFWSVISFGRNLLQQSLISGARLALTRTKPGYLLFSQHG